MSRIQKMLERGYAGPLPRDVDLPYLGELWVMEADADRMELALVGGTPMKYWVVAMLCTCFGGPVFAGSIFLALSFAVGDRQIDSILLTWMVSGLISLGVAGVFYTLYKKAKSPNPSPSPAPAVKSSSLAAAAARPKPSPSPASTATSPKSSKPTAARNWNCTCTR